MKSIKEKLEKQLSDLENNISEIKEIIAPYQSKLSSLVDLKKEILSQLDILNVEYILTRPREEQAEYCLYSQNKGSSSFDYSQKFFKSIGFGSTSFNSITNQYSLYITLKEDKSNIDLVYEGLLFILPFMKHDNGLVRFEIMDHSQEETYFLVFDVETKLWSFTTHYQIKYRQKCYYASENLRSVLRFIAENYYY